MSDSNLKFRQTTSGAHGSAGRADCLPRRKPLFIFQKIRPEGVQGASGKPPAYVGVRQLCRKKIRCWGLGTPTTAGESRQLRCPKVSKGRAESPLVRPQAHTPCPGWGPDAPTPARMVGLPPRGGQYFLSKRKKVPKKARGTATTKTAHVAARRGLRPAVAPSGLSSASARCAHPPEKGFYCPF